MPQPLHLQQQFPTFFKIARDVNAATYDTFSAFGIAAVLYAVLAFILIWIFRKLENVGWHF